MKNVNKLVLESFQQTIVLPAAANSTDFNDIDRIVNDLGKAVDVIGMQISISILDQSLGVSARGVVISSLGTQNGWDKNTNIYNWISKIEKDATVAEPFGTDNSINEFIGNMKDTLFTIPAFSAEVSGGNSSRGQIFLNVRAESFGTSTALNYKALITLYLK